MGHNWRDKRVLYPSYICKTFVKNLIKMHARGIIIYAWRRKKIRSDPLMSYLDKNHSVCRVLHPKPNTITMSYTPRDKVHSFRVVWDDHKHLHFAGNARDPKSITKNSMVIRVLPLMLDFCW
jgi:hypothetical protein